VPEACSLSADTQLQTSHGFIYRHFSLGPKILVRLLQSKDGTCTTSCCGTMISSDEVIAFPASLLYPFLTASSRQKLLCLEAAASAHAGRLPRSQVNSQHRQGPAALSFLPGVSLELMVHKPSATGACIRETVELSSLQPVNVQGVKSMLQQASRASSRE
jgi:hypothetical protein